MGNVNLLSVAGVAYDIVGAILLAQAIVFSREKLVAAQSGTYVGGNPAVFAALDEQQHDGRFGLGLLVLGFVFQFLGSLNIALPVSYWPAAAAIPIAALVCYGISARQRKKTRGEQFQAHLARMKEASREASKRKG